jgi:hypothetical protein
MTVGDDNFRRRAGEGGLDVDVDVDDECTSSVSSSSDPE